MFLRQSLQGLHLTGRDETVEEQGGEQGEKQTDARCQTKGNKETPVIFFRCKSGI